MKQTPWSYLSTRSIRQQAHIIFVVPAITLVVLLVTAFVALPANAQGACSVRADSLANAKSIYAQQCSSVRRRDCDSLNGVWYCSSETIGESVPGGLVNGTGASAGNAATQSTTSNSSNRPCLDPDGDGWGWNGDSCEVGGTNTSNQSSSPESSAGSSSSSSTGGSGPCIDPDGDGWGWNGDSCKVSDGQQQSDSTNNQASSNSSGGTGVCLDPDGDGWGWRDGRSCEVSSVSSSASTSTLPSSSGQSFQPSNITDLVLLTGQSNALGANTSFDASIDRPDDQVFAFTSTGWQRADLHQIWDRGWHPRNHPETDPSNNLLLHFGRRLVSRDSSRVVGFILVSAPGAPIAHWDYNDDFYNSIRARVLDAINQLPHKSQLDGILWHQGETDALDTAAYGSKLSALIRNFRTENWFSSRKPFICGEIAKRGGVNNRLNALNNDGDAATACVSSSGLQTKIDNSHFTAEGLRGLGQRYADQYYSMTR